jgi:DHA1 family tetracycline resistance protein-like MFS transporter
MPLYATIFLGFFGYALTVALFIPMLLDPQSSLLSAHATQATRLSLAGLLLAMYPLGQFIGSPIIGKLSDHYGQKRILLISMATCIIGFSGIALSIHISSLILLFITCTLTGLCESNMAIAQSVIAQITHEPALKTKLIGYAFSACSLGYIAGPLIGGLSTAHMHSYSAAFWLTAILMIPLILWTTQSLLSVPRSTTQKSLSIIESFSAFKTLWTRKPLRFFYLLNFAIFFAIQGLYRVVPMYVQDTWNPNLHVFTLLISIASIACFLTSLFFMGRLASRFKTKPLLAGLLLFSALFSVAIIIPHKFHFIWITYLLAAIPTIMALTTCTTWLSDQADKHEQGQVLGNNQALLVFAEASSAAIGGAIAGAHPALPIVIMAGIFLVTGIIATIKK